jgi:hypothetical protein
MFFRRKPSPDYAVQYFEELVQVVRNSDPNARKKETYHQAACVLGFYVHALRYANCTDEEVKSIIRSITQCLMKWFDVDEGRLIDDMSLVFDTLESHGNFYIAASEAFYQKRRVSDPISDKEEFVGAVTRACDYLCATFIERRFIKPNESVAFLRFQRGLLPKIGIPN